MKNAVRLKGVDVLSIVARWPNLACRWLTNPQYLTVAELQTPCRTHEIEASVATGGRYSLLDETIKTNNQAGGKAEDCQLSVFCVREGYR